MAIKQICNMCKRSLDYQGATLSSPPNEDNVSIKFHLCKSCYKTIEKRLV